jgi:glycosyltransferase involved in cell wall biosynthesis
MVPSRQQFDGTRRGDFLRASLGYVVPNGIDADLFRPRRKPELRAELGLPDGRLLVSVGRLSRVKGMDVAIRALGSLATLHDDARLVLVGRGEEEPALRALADELGVATRVVFAGPQPPERVAAYLAAADLFLFPTTREEAAPLVLPQAMACGLPVVASRIGGIPEVVGDDGLNGLLVEPGDTAAVVEESNRVLSDEELRRRLGQAARSRVLAEYTVERMVERTVAVYEAAAARLDGGGLRPHEGSTRDEGRSRASAGAPE